MLTACVEWTGSKNEKGYGLIWRKGLSPVRAHRAIWMGENGDIPDGMVLRHKCDNPSCINLEHLELGTPAQNSRDMVSRGRSARGMRHGMAKLSDEDVRQIRVLISLGVRGNWIAETFCVGAMTVSHIKNGTTWHAQVL